VRGLGWLGWVIVLSAGCGKQEYAAPKPPPVPMTASAPPLAAPADPVATITATLVPGPQPHLDVLFDLPLGWVPVDFVDVRLAFKSEPFREGADGYDDFIQSLTPGGQPTPWVDTFPAAERIHIRYRVALVHETRGPVHGIDEVPHPTSTGWFLNGRAFVPRVSVRSRSGDTRNIDTAARLTLTVPAGWRLLGSAPREGEAFVGPDLGAVRDAIWIAGRLRTVEVGEHTIASSDFEVAELEPLRQLVGSTLAAATASLGEPPPGKRLIVFDRGSELGGGVVGRGISLIHPERPSASALSSLGIVVVHELAHLWNQADRMWLHEGFARYFEIMLSHEIDGASAQATADALQRVHVSHVAQALSASPPVMIAETRGSAAYAAGAMVAFCADAELRALGGSLAQVHTEARRMAFPLRAEELLARLEKHSDATARSTRERLGSAVPIDLRPCFANAGFELKKVDEPRRQRSPDDGARDNRSQWCRRRSETEPPAGLKLGHPVRV
jgi:predicted metalloprotease with PDZ domain